MDIYEHNLTNEHIPKNKIHMLNIEFLKKDANKYNLIGFDYQTLS